MSKYKDFYVYALLDPRKEGSYSYGKYDFYYEPFYVGRGRKNRCDFHTLPSRLDESYSGLKGHNPRKIRKIKKILEQGLELIILKIYENLPFDCSKVLEQKIIFSIKRIEDGGPLTSLTQGGDGVEGFSLSEEAKAKISEGNKRRGTLPTKSLEKMSKTKKDFFSDPIASADRRQRMRDNAVIGIKKRAERMVESLALKNLPFNEDYFNAERLNYTYPTFVTIRDKYHYLPILQQLYSSRLKK